MFDHISKSIKLSLNSKQDDKYSIFKLHKYAYFGKLELFKQYYNYSNHNKFEWTLNYCIIIGILRNIEFAKYILISSNLMNKKNGRSFVYSDYLISSFINNGEFDKRLNYKQGFLHTDFLALTNKENVLKLIGKDPNLDLLLAYIVTINYKQYDKEDIWNQLNITNQYSEHIKKLVYYYNLPDYDNKYPNYKFAINVFTDLSIFSKFKYNEGDLDLNLFNKKITIKSLKEIYNYNDNSPELASFHYSKIRNIDKYILNHETKLSMGRSTSNSGCGNYSRREILEHVEKAIELYNSGKLINVCISKFVCIDPEYSLQLIKVQHNDKSPFLIFCNYGYNVEYINEYKLINPLYKYVFLYSNILINNTKVYMMKYIGIDDDQDDFIEYNLIQACLVSGNMEHFDQLMSIYKKLNKCYKLIDFENEQFLENNYINIKLDEEELKSQVKFDISYYNNYNYLV
ncbi:uncharacterized protein J8A68_003361 [[Candida] subhashii]|uniref:Uncharacterized protein n=1 Tax=[Candida] subhashii TaxID=561895 RepID=A0A8J5QM76_9ASCO|nr:uncharacterized protein J8A68_003361 [[Candida] subhashii]KAG7663116.1 hypothetical protein J8A68_003361 [[Candida] subhashii]